MTATRAATRQVPAVSLTGVEMGACCFIQTPGNRTLPLTGYAVPGFTISGLYNLKTATGTCTVSIYINGVVVTGLSALAVTTSGADVVATALNTVTVGDSVTLTISDAVCSGLQFTLKGVYT